MWSKFKSWFSGLSGLGKIIVASFIAGSIGTLAVAGANPNPNNQPANTQQSEVKAENIQPKIEKQTTTEIVEVPFESTSVNDASLDKGKTLVTTQGVKGSKTLTYEQTLTNGVPGDKILIKEEITVSPVTQVTSIGTKVTIVPKPSNCDSNYSGACVPIASDVDCAGGGGNGPAYVSGPVYVVGSDIYDLDRDGNGIGCE